MTHTELRTRLSRDAFHEAVTAASRAPSMHNSQPWRFHLDEEHDAVQVRADRARTPPLADRSGWAMRVAGGAATYNLWLSLTVRARPYRVSWQPANADPDLLAVLSPAGGAALDAAARAELERLHRAIGCRHSVRTPLRAEPVPSDARAAILQAARGDGAWGELVIGPVAVMAVAEITRAAQRILDGSAGYSAEQRAWTSHSRHVAAGEPARAVWESDAHAGGAGPQPLVLVLGTAGDLPIDHLRAGYALQRVLLTITDLGLAYQLFSQPIEVPAAREQLRLALGRQGTPQMVLRIGYGDVGPTSPRPAVDGVIADDTVIAVD